MTSKSLEILERVKYAPDFMGGHIYYTSTIGSNIVYAQDIETIKKDLERLEMLEKFIALLKRRCFKYHLSEATDEEYEFLREVLENENRSN